MFSCCCAREKPMKNYVTLKILITGMNQKERIQYLSSLADEAIETTESGVIEFSLDF